MIMIVYPQPMGEIWLRFLYYMSNMEVNLLTFHKLKETLLINDDYGIFTLVSNTDAVSVEQFFLQTTQKNAGRQCHPAF
ncbi:hypothetical protein [Sandarakinorhabdus sp.]|uniref:hypothetical protein n=1 Tax=Sandarakinorhabdus sp. TaxID=1916663 RepID=UPI00333EFF92